MAAKLKGLHTAPSLESCDTQLAQVTFDGPPSRKRKAHYTDSSVLGLKRACDSPPESCDASSYMCTQTQQEWGSPDKNIDLSSSDSLEDSDFDLREGEFSVCSSAQSEDWTFLIGDSRGRYGSTLELASLEVEPVKLNNSPTKQGEFMPKPLPPHCLVAATAYQYGFSPLVVAVGTTYFQRIAAIDSQLKQAAHACPDFAAHVADVPDLPSKVTKSIGAPLHQCQTPRHWLLAVHLTCIYLAAKNLESVPYRHLLRTMLQRLHGPAIGPQHAEQLELEVLIALEWRLGPYFQPKDSS